MKDRTLALILTIASALFCGLPGLCMALSGGVIVSSALAGPVLPNQGDPIAEYVSYGFIGIGLLMVLFTVGVAIFTLRKPKEEPGEAKVNADDPIPPAL